MMADEKKFLRLALIGREVSRSPSPSLHRSILKELGAECSYENLSVAEADFGRSAAELFERFDGFNVTMPYKRTILPFLTRLDGAAAALLSVNTVLCEGRIGYNTDCGGFSAALSAEGIVLSGKRALVLGAGGAGRSCIRALQAGGAEVSVYEKDPARLREVYETIGGFRPLDRLEREPFALIVNCTGVGMHESEGLLPAVRTPWGERLFGGEFLDGCEAAIDLIYAPARSAFLNEAQRHGAKIINGAGMLFFQAYLADCIFLNREPDLSEAVRFKKKTEEVNQ